MSTLTAEERIKKLEALLSDDLFDSKDWTFDSDVEWRVEWLLTMYQMKCRELDYYLAQGDSTIDFND